MNTLVTQSEVIPRQALIVGQIVDALDRRRPRFLPVITISYQLPNQASQPAPLEARIGPSGLLVVLGDPGSALPVPDPGQDLTLRLSFTAERYESQSVDLTLSRDQLTPTEQTRTINGDQRTVMLLDAPLAQLDVALTPSPVHLMGRVVVADDPELPIGNAELTVTAPIAQPMVTSDANGFFTIPDLPSAMGGAEGITTVRVAAMDFQTETVAVRLDHSRAVHQQTFVLTAST